MPKQRSVNTHNDLDQETRERMVTLLNQQMADTFDLFSQTKQAHWNVKGPQFYQLHLLYDTLAEGLEGYVDEIAERTTALGGVAMGTVRMAAEETRLPEFPPGPAEAMESVQCLVDRYSNLGASTRAAIDEADEAGDADTADLFTQISRDLDKWLYFLESHLQ